MSKIFNEFKPYEKEETYNVLLSRDEALIIQRLRSVKYGTMMIHMVAGKPVRIEITNSEMIKDAKGESITIAYEVTGK